MALLNQNLMLPGANDNYFRAYLLNNIDGACVCVCVNCGVLPMCRWLIVLHHLILAQYNKSKAEERVFGGGKNPTRRNQVAGDVYTLLFTLGSGII